MKKNLNRNPNGFNQWELRSNEEIQKIINQHPSWTKKDFRGEGKLNSKKILTRKETERSGLIFENVGRIKHYKDDKLKCSMCMIYKDLEDFPNDVHASNGKRSNCSSCDVIRNEQYRESIKIK